MSDNRCNYHADLDWDAKELAVRTGIAAGWIQPLGDAYKVGCEICGFSDTVTLDRVELVATTFDIETAIEELVHARFGAWVEQSGCPHYAEYQDAKANRKPEIEWGALLRLMDSK